MKTKTLSAITVGVLGPAGRHLQGTAGIQQRVGESLRPSAPGIVKAVVLQDGLTAALVQLHSREVRQ